MTDAGRATLVLVHGAWHGPWCWTPLLPHLRAQFRSVECPELPSVASPTPAGLDDDARHLRELLQGIDGPLVLCGHSYGGMVLSALQEPLPQIYRLIYLCAYLVQPHESLDASLRAAGERRPGHWIRQLPDGRTQVDPARARELFYQDCQSVTQDWALQRMRPHWGQVLRDSVPQPAWQRYPTTYVVCDDDRVLAPSIQREVYARRAQQQVTLHSGHSPFLSGPLQLAQLLVAVAQ